MGSIIMVAIRLVITFVSVIIRLLFVTRLWPAALYTVFLGTVLGSWSGAHEQASMISIGVVACLCLLTWFLPSRKGKTKAK